MGNSRTAGNYRAEKSRTAKPGKKRLCGKIREELDTEVETGELVDMVEYDYPSFHLSMACYLCTVKSGNLVLKEHEAARWLDRENLNSVEWLPADWDLVEKLKNYLQE